MQGGEKSALARAGHPGAERGLERRRPGREGRDAIMSMGRWREGHPNALTVTVGPRSGADLVGQDNIALQAAVDYVAGVGGGTVEIEPGTYTMHDSLHLRSHVTVRGAGEDTILWKPPAVKSALSSDIVYGHWDVSLAQPDKFRPGMGVYIYDDCTGGFARTVATLLYRDGDRFGINRALHYDYCRHRNAVVVSVYPLVSGVNVEDAAVIGLRLEGNSVQNESIDGCRGGGLYLLGCTEVLVRDLTVHDFHGDGVSFQQCYDPVLEDVRAVNCRGTGFHPGSGTTRPQMRRLVSRGNDGEGLFYCVRVTDSVLEDSEFVGNAGNGVNVGHRDTDHIIRHNLIRDNGRAGIFFRPLDYAVAGHRTQVLDNLLEGNCRQSGVAEVDLDAELEGIVVAGNRIRPAAGKIGLRIGPQVRSVEVGDNDVKAEAEMAVVDERAKRP